ncbi:MAG: tetratricopeptide repeat protein [Chromatiaceae bacterium]
MARRFFLPLPLLVSLTAGAPPGAQAAPEIGEQMYNGLAKVHKLLEAGRYDEAKRRLSEIRLGETSPYERALVLQTYGYLHARAGEYEQAIDALKRCLDAKALPREATRGALFVLAQSQAASAQYGEAARSLDRWSALSGRSTAEEHGFAGSTYARVRRSDDAVRHLTKAISMSPKATGVWYRELLAVYAAEKRYAAAADLLETMVERFPGRKDYWFQLAAAYQAMGSQPKAAAALELAYQQELPFTEQDLVDLAWSLMRLGLPYRAGVLLSGALRRGSLSGTARHWELLSDAWVRARELPRALAALGRAIDLGPNGDLLARRATLAAQLEDWDLVVASAKAALALGGLREPGTTHLLLGIAHHWLGRRDDALKAFEKASEFESSRSQARVWVDFITHGLPAPLAPSQAPQHHKAVTADT